ncbi:MAG: hypothetical protein ACXVA9_08600 [Bdellovibrionales bacterium]
MASKAVKKKAPAKKAPAAKKAAKKIAQPVKKAKPAKEPQQESFMWKLLKKKEAERKQMQEQNKKSKFNMHAPENQLPTGIQGYSRFAGPRRKAA